MPVNQKWVEWEELHQVYPHNRILVVKINLVKILTVIRESVEVITLLEFEVRVASEVVEWEVMI